MTTTFINHLQSELRQIYDSGLHITGCRQVFGGDINTTYIVTSNEGNFFVKLNAAAFADMLVKEMHGLTLLNTVNICLKIPRPLLQGTFEQQSYLLMEYLEKGTESKQQWQQLATGLAQLHQTSHDYFGLEYNNYIGTIAQSNTPATNWTTFYAEHRILRLMQNAYNQGKCTVADVQLAEQFCCKLSTLITEEPPALLHGDLWNGNQMFTANGEAAVFDPAVYFGHREMDIAMTLLFGGFDTLFYSAYNEQYPLAQGWQNRISIFQLYPLLVHLILFGGHYYNRVISIFKKYR